MKIRDIIQEDAVSTVFKNVAPTVTGSAAAATHSNPIVKALGNYGPGIASAASDIAQGNITGALLNAFTAVAPNSNIPALAKVGNYASMLQLLWNIAKNPVTLGAFLALYSPGLNAGEDEEIRRIHAAQDRARKSP